MKTIVVANHKGGVGKTSLLVHLAFYFKEQNKKVLFIDLDPQANASFSLKTYKTGVDGSALFLDAPVTLEKAEKGALHLISADHKLATIDQKPVDASAAAFKKQIESLGKGYDICLIDIGPSLGARMVVSLLVADFVLSPIELETYSIQGIKDMVTTIANLKKHNAKLNFLGLVANRIDSRSKRHKDQLLELQTAYSKYMAPVVIKQRNSIADAVANGMAVWHIKSSAAREAAKEILQLAKFVEKAIGEK